MAHKVAYNLGLEHAKQNVETSGPSCPTITGLQQTLYAVSQLFTYTKINVKIPSAFSQ